MHHGKQLSLEKGNHVHHGNLSLRLITKSAEEKRWAKFYPPFIWIMRSRVLLDVFYQFSVRQEGLSIHRNKPTSSSQIQNDPLQILSFSFGGKALKKANLKMKHSKKGTSVWFAQPSLLNIPLLWQDLHGKCILKCPGSLTSHWQMMDGSNPTPGIQNDKVQEWRGWVTVAKEMNRRGDLHSRRLHHLFLHDEDNEWGDNSRNSFPARSTGLKKTPSQCFCVCVSSLVNMWRGFKGLWTRPWLRITKGWANLPSGLGAGNAPLDPAHPFYHHSITPLPSRSHQSHLKDRFMISKQVQIQKRIRKCLNL